MPKFKFAKVTEASLNEAGAQMPVGYKARVRCICGHKFITLGIGWCPKCNAGLVITQEKDSENFMPITHLPDGTDVSQITSTPAILDWIPE